MSKVYGTAELVYITSTGKRALVKVRKGALDRSKVSKYFGVPLDQEFELAYSLATPFQKEDGSPMAPGTVIDIDVPYELKAMLDKYGNEMTLNDDGETTLLKLVPKE